MTDVTQLRATLAQRLRKAKQAQLEQRLKALGSKAGQLAAPAAEPAAVPRWAPGEGFQSYLDGVLATPAPVNRELVGLVGDGKLYRNPDNSLGFANDAVSFSNPGEIQSLLETGNPKAASRAGSEKTTLGMNLAGARAWARARGVPLFGEYTDEAYGALRGQEKRQDMEAIESKHREQMPGDALANSLAVGVPLGAGTAVAAAGLAGGAGASALAGRVLSGGFAAPATIGQYTLAGLGTGALEGTISGFGRGATPQGRKDDGSWHLGERGVNAATGGVIGGAAGAGLGAISGGLVKGAGAIARNLKGGSVASLMDDVGIDSPAAAKDIRDQFGPNAPAVKAYLAKLDLERATIPEVDPNARLYANATAQKSSTANHALSRSTEQRVAEEGAKLTQTLDHVLAQVPKVEGQDYAMQELDAVRYIADSFKPKLQPLYDAAYATSIDYGSPAGQRVMKAAATSIKRGGSAGREALEVANAMIDEQGLSRQILADIGEDGSVRFLEEPSTIQLDYLKRALQDTAYANVNDIGRLTPKGQILNNAARELRQALGAANPAYDQAVKMGGDAIAVREAVEAGANLFNSKQAITEAREAAEKSMETRAAYRLGARIAINRKYTDLQSTLGDLASQAELEDSTRQIKAFRSDVAKNKLKAIIGTEAASTIDEQVSRTAKALQSRLATNSETAARQHIAQRQSGHLTGLGLADDKGAIQPLMPARKAIADAIGVGSNAQSHRADAMNEAIAKFLTLRGQDASRALDRVGQSYRAAQSGTRLSRSLGRIAQPLPMTIAPHLDGLSLWDLLSQGDR